MMIFEDTDNLNMADKNDLALSLFWLLILSPIQISSNWNFVFFFLIVTTLQIIFFV